MCNERIVFTTRDIFEILNVSITIIKKKDLFMGYNHIYIISKFQMKEISIVLINL